MNTQKGSAHVIIIAGLAVLLIGTLGFIFWQNFMNKESKVAENSTSTNKDSSSEELITYEERYLQLAEWKVKVPLAESSAEYSLGSIRPQPSEGGEYMYVIDKAATEGCDAGNDTIGSVARFKADFVIDINGDKTTAREMVQEQSNTSPTTVSSVDKGDFVYAFYTPISACSDNIEVIKRMSAATTEFARLFKGLTE